VKVFPRMINVYPPVKSSLYNVCSFSASSSTSSLLVDPIALPDMSHVDIPATTNENSNSPRLFYATGDKNPNMLKQVEDRLVPTPLEDIENNITKKLKKTAKKKTKMSSYLVPVYKPSGPEPSRKGELYYTKKPDPATAKMIKDMRKNESKMRLKVGSET